MDAAGVAQLVRDELARSALGASVRALQEVRGRVIVTGAGTPSATFIVNDGLGTTAKTGIAGPDFVGATFVADSFVCDVAGVTEDTTTFAILTRLGGNFTLALTVAISYRIWRTS